MKLNFKSKIAIAALTAIVSSGVAKAASLVTLTVESSTSGDPGTYSSSLPSAPAAGSSLFYEVVAQYAATGTTNTNTAKTPNGTTDTIVSLPTFTLTSSADTTFGGTSSTNPVLDNNFGGGSGASAGTPGSNALNVRAIEQGFTENADSQLQILSGQITVGASFTGITIANVSPITAPGSLKIGTSPIAVTQATETSGDQLIGFQAMTVSPVPAPSVLGGASALAALGAFGMVVRSRKTYLA